MKRILALVLVCVILFSSVSAFASIRGEESIVKELNEYGILKGDPDGNMRLQYELTRAEAATLLIRLYGYETAETEVVTVYGFSDMEGHWAYNDVMLAKKVGIADGTSDTIFSPDEKITAQEFLKMLVCLLGYKEAAEKKAPDYIGYILQASQSGITKDVPLITDKPISRKDAVKLICNSLDVPIMVQTSYGKNNEYIIMDGKNGVDYKTLRTILDQR